MKLRRINVACCGMKVGEIYDGVLTYGGIYAKVKLRDGSWTGDHFMNGFFEIVEALTTVERGEG